MPSYDYRCDANGQVVEVRHRMSEELKTWSELAAAAGIEVGDTAPDSPVRRLATGGHIVSGSDQGAPPMPGGGCCGGGCGIH